MTRACDCFACGFVPFGLSGTSSMSGSVVFPFISCLSVFGRRASDDFCSCNELFLLGVRVSYSVLWVIFSAYSYVRECYTVGLLISGVFSTFPLFFWFLYIQGDSPNKIFSEI